jgi:GntR family transcriptional regulator
MDLLALPLHQRISNHLRKQIETHALKPGDMLPSEKELCSQFTVSRITVRKALSELHALGLIYSVPGKGTFVAMPQIKAKLAPLASFTSDMERRGFKVTSQVLAESILQADGTTAEKFRVAPGSEIVKLDRLRLLLPGEIPVALQKILLLHSRCPGILNFDFSTTSLYNTLQNHYGLVFDRAETTVTARMSNSEENQLLKLKRSSALLENYHTTYLNSGEILEVADSVFRPDLYQFEIVVEGRSISLH